VWQNAALQTCHLVKCNSTETHARQHESGVLSSCDQFAISCTTLLLHVVQLAGCAGSALQRPHLLGGASDRADVRYNAACAAALAGQHSIAQQLLMQLAAAGSLSAADAAADEDLASIKGQQWFQELVRSLQGS
jgi:HEAT repeat protein